MFHVPQCSIEQHADQFICHIILLTVMNYTKLIKHEPILKTFLKYEIAILKFIAV